MRTNGRWDDLNHEGKDGGAVDGYQYFICEWDVDTPAVTAPTITTTELPSGVKGEAYSATVTATGDEPITWTAEGLPDGLTFSEGLISGTPTASGTFTVTVTATNPGGSDSKRYTLTVSEPVPEVIAPTITTATIPEAKTGEDYRVVFEATGTAPITWVITGDKLPVGISFSEDGLLAGKTTGSGTYSLTITATNTAGSDSRTFTLTVNNPAPSVTAPAIKTEKIPGATTGTAYTTKLAATGTAPITWTADGLPDGFMIDASTGVITGMPTTAGEYSITVTATNTAGADTKNFTLSVTAKVKPPKITTTSLPEATQDSSYTARLTAEGSGLTWSATGLPKNLTLTKDGEISGTPAVAGTFRVVVTVKNSAGVDSAALSLTVKIPESSSVSRPNIKTSKLPDGFIGEEYSYQLEAEGEVDEWRISEGELPKGLELDPSAGEISGQIKTSSAKSFKIKVIATNDAGDSKVKALTLKVSSKSPSFKTDTLKAAKFGSNYSCTVKPVNLKATMWSIAGDLPVGITFDKGKFSGKPQEVGDFEVTVTASNGAVEVTQDFELVVKGIPPKLKGSFKSGSEGEEYSYTFKATGTTPINWEFDELPDGLDYTPDATGETCTVSGIPTKAFNDKVAVTITNGETDEDSLTKNLKLTIKAVKPTFDKTVKPHDGVVGEDYYFEFALKKSPVELEWEYDGDLPEGLTFDDGVIEGIPEESRTFKFTVTVRNANKQSDKATFNATIRISDPDDPIGVIPEPKPDKPEPKFVNGVACYERGELSAETLARAANNGEVIAAVLPAIEVEEANTYEFEVELEPSAREGATLVWHSYPDGEYDPDDGENAIFLDGDEITESVPASLTVTVSAWLEPGVIYEPVIAVKAQ